MRQPGHLSIYLCGPTVYGPPHLGHGRATLVYDILRRYLTWTGIQVRLVSNITDIDDKIIDRANRENRPWAEITQKCETMWFSAMAALNVEKPNDIPHATEYVDQMVAMIGELIGLQRAYATSDGVYLSVTSVDDYGLLAHQKLEDMLAGGGDREVFGASEKKHPADFALWKFTKPGEPAWPSPWGEGRPGWHSECVVMSLQLLGEGFDLHCGGADLRFPHHENEVAQSKAAGQQFANFWLHNYWVTQSGEKMSKSLGNTMKVSEILSRFRAIDVRFYLLSAHYRSNLEFSDQALSDASTAFSRIEQFVIRASEKVGEVSLAQVLPKAFQEAMDEDIATPSAFAVIHEFVTNGNTALANNDKDLKDIYVQVRTMLDILGLDPLNKQWQKETSQDSTKALDSLIQSMLKQRNDARASKNFEVADSVRDALNSAGILIEDTSQGSRWSINKETK